MVKHEGFSGAERPLFSAEILRGPETRGSAGKQRKLGWENPGTTMARKRQEYEELEE